MRATSRHSRVVASSAIVTGRAIIRVRRNLRSPANAYAAPSRACCSIAPRRAAIHRAKSKSTPTDMRETLIAAAGSGVRFAPREREEPDAEQHREPQRREPGQQRRGDGGRPVEAAQRLTSASVIAPSVTPSPPGRNDRAPAMVVPA